MKISVVCRSCRKLYELSAKFAGKHVMCKSCGSRLEVPRLEAPDELTLTLDDDEESLPLTASGILVEEPRPPQPTAVYESDVIPLAADRQFSNAPPSAFPPPPPGG